MEDLFYIDVSPLLEDFAHKLETENRVIFSAGFGDGKTYFLNEFKKKYNDDYYFFTVYPVNYVISENEHIIEYIKRDILIQLANDQGYYFDKIKPKEVLKGLADSCSLSGLFSFATGFPFLSKLTNAISGVEDVTLGSFIDNVKEAHYSTNKYRDSFNYRGSLYENDVYTSFIACSLENLRKDGHKTVLIIEDLDRIDPGKIFNILNIFSAHVDRHFVTESSDEINNKFGFDKVITVMDNSKVEKCFNYLYGEDQNFHGYISKFMESRPFDYSIKELAIKYVADKLYSVYHIDVDSNEVRFYLRTLLKDRSIRDLERIFNFNPSIQFRHDIDRTIGDYSLSADSPLCSIEAYYITFNLDLIKGLIDGVNRIREPLLYYKLSASYNTLANGNIIGLSTDKGYYKFTEMFSDDGYLFTSVDTVPYLSFPYNDKYRMDYNVINSIRKQIRKMMFS